jgi:imidazolonepropionase-like amidohydrolase
LCEVNDEPITSTGFAGSVSSQIGHLRQLLTTSTSGPFHDAATGKIPLVVAAFDASDISKVLRLKAANPSLRLVLLGATGSWEVANDIAKAKVPVLLLPFRCVPAIWEMRSCRVPSVSPTTFEILKKAGVDVLISVASDDQVRSLLWEAGWAFADGDLGIVSVGDALGSVTWNVAKAFGLSESGAGRILVGKRANIVGLNGGPFGYEYTVQVLADGAEVTTRPIHD